MIFKGLKKKSAQKYLNKILSRGGKVPSKENDRIKKIGCIIDAEVFTDFEVFSELAKELDIRNFNLSIVCYHGDTHMHSSFNRNMFSDDDFGWRGAFKSPALQQFTDKDYDLLLNYYEDPEKLPLQLLTAQTQATFKAGFLSVDPRLNDLVITGRVGDYELFKSELLKYLAILKKI